MSAALSDVDAEALIDAAAALLGLDITPSFRPGIIANLQATTRFAAILLDGEIDDEVEQAPIFVP